MKLEVKVVLEAVTDKVQPTPSLVPEHNRSLFPAHVNSQMEISSILWLCHVQHELPTLQKGKELGSVYARGLQVVPLTFTHTPLVGTQVTWSHPTAREPIAQRRGNRCENQLATSAKTEFFGVTFNSDIMSNLEVIKTV